MSGGMENMDKRQHLEDTKRRRELEKMVVKVIDDLKWVMAEEIIKVLKDEAYGGK